MQYTAADCDSMQIIAVRRAPVQIVQIYVVQRCTFHPLPPDVPGCMIGVVPDACFTL